MKRGPLLTHPRYVAGDVLGRGAQGVVVRVVDREAESRSLVAKIATGAGDERAWLVGEFARLSRLRLPGVVAAHDLARDARTGAPFLVEDYVDGPDAVEWLATAHDDVARASRLVALLAGGARALASLHDASFVHGDVKPAHVRMGERGATLLDLGCAVARRTARASAGHTRPFAAPEVLAGAPPSPRSDLYSLGATARAAMTGAPAPWVPGSARALLESLLAQHPEDRPEDARAVLAALRHDTAPRASALFHSPLVGRDREVSEVLAARSGVLYLTGPSGMGKTALAREVVTRALLEGREARFVDGAFARAAELVAFFRGARDPFATTPTLLVIDDPSALSDELPLAIEAFRCHGTAEARDLLVVVAAREAPRGAATVVLEPLDRRALRDLCVALDVGGDDAIERSVRAAKGNPGWLLAERGHVPLAAEAIVARASSLAPPARALLADLATLGGDVPARLADDDAALDELFEAGLAERHGANIALAAPRLASEIARALGSFERSDALAVRLLADAATPARALLALATAEHGPRDRRSLLVLAADRARVDVAPGLETEALLQLLADPRERAAARIVRLERLTRDAGRTPAHAEVVRWLVELARTDASVLPLALRREAEVEARAGRHDRGLLLAKEAEEAARAASDPAAQAFARSTQGAVSLYRADYRGAAEAFAAARERLADAGTVDDREEVARLDHNLGVVALYEDDVPRAVEAFERSMTQKRALGDVAGVRACLLNLGIALTRLRRFDDARRALAESMALARSLGQGAGLGWSLSARADLALREGRTTECEGLVAEAEALGDALPVAVRSDLALLRVEIAVAEGRADDARRLLADGLTAEERADDAATDARASLLEARAHACSLPANRREASRAAIRALRRARDAGLAELAHEAEHALRTYRGTAMTNDEPDTPRERHEDEATWVVLDALAASGSRAEAVHGVLRHVLELTAGERAFLVVRGRGDEVHGLDVDGLPLADADKRLPQEEVATTLARRATTYVPEVATKSGAGSRLVVAASEEVALVVEHRFVKHRFDGVSATTIRQLATLARLAARIDGVDAAEGDAAVPSAMSSRSTPAYDVSTITPREGPRRRFPGIVGESQALTRALDRLDAALDADLPLLVVGETGSGKELFAAAAHELGPRARGPFVPVNCAALPASLFEAELFGHTRGAFTGASAPRKGLLARAEGGTLFLDEIGELALAQQASLLRVLESRKYRPVGSDDERPFDVRIITATNRDLARAVDEGTFRQDLYYRLRVLEVRVPPLRERAGDVPLLARFFLESAGSRAELSPRALDALTSYPWPGNVRELAHQMQRIAAMRPKRVEAEHLGREIRGAAPVRTRGGAAEGHERDERDEVQRALEATNGNISRAATVLGLTRHGLKKRMLRLGLRARSESGS